jgi:glucose-1-phosphate thymidylyltransferase
MKGIILSGGMGTRLFPSTVAVSKQLIPVYDKPMIYYPLSVLMLAGINDILIITTKYDLSSYKKLFKGISKIGIKITFAVQAKPRGLVDAFIIGKKFIGKDDVCLILGDNIFYGDGLTDYLKKSINTVRQEKNAVLFSYPVADVSNYGIVNIKNNKIISIIEKPKKTKSTEAVVGLYFYPNSVIRFAKNVRPSKRKELEITDLNNIYLKKNILKVQRLGRGFSWHDAGSPNNLHEASQLISIIEKRIGYKIGCIEEIAYKNKWINKNNLSEIVKRYNDSEYKTYLKKII